ncbi:MAG: hypothetical protein J5684_07790 [Eubacterium sp.]|nr:hypothetical protein [Eubacterium sp.]
MRQMMEEFEEKPIEKKEDNRLELQSMSRKERRKMMKAEMKENMEGMDPGEKFKYLIYYYKEAIIFIALIGILVFTGGRALYNSRKPVVISYGVVNCMDQLNFNSSAFEDYAKAIGKYKGYQIRENINIGFTNNNNSTFTNQMNTNFLTLSTQNYYDVIFTDKEGADFCSKQSAFHPLDSYLDKEHYDLIKDHIYSTKDSDGNTKEFAVDISDTEFANSLNIGYNDVYIGFTGAEERNIQAVYDLLDYLYK